MKLYTKTQLARMLGVDFRSKAIKSLEPQGVVVMGKREVELYAFPQK